MEFKDLRAYQESQKLVGEVEKSSLPRDWYSVRDQMRRAAVSVPLNISEAWGRDSNREKRHFLSIAAGSAREVQACLDTVHRLGLLSNARFVYLDDRCDHVASMLGKLRKCLE